MRHFRLRGFVIVHRLDRWVRRRFTSAGLLVLGSALVTGMFAVDVRRTLAYQIFALGAALLALAIVSALSFRGRFSCERVLPRFAVAGVRLRYQVLVRNHRANAERDLRLREHVDTTAPSSEEFRRAREPHPERRNWFDRLVGYPRFVWLMAQRRGAHGEEQSVPDIPPNGEVSVEMGLTPTRRGVIRLPGLHIIRSDPLGIFNAIRRAGVSQSILALPRCYPLAWSGFPGASRGHQSGSPLTASTGSSNEFMAVRDYRPGDPLRHIHWKGWARFGQPCVKEFLGEVDRREAVLLDTLASPQAQARFEEAVSVAASFVSVADTQQCLLDLMWADAGVRRVSAGPGIGPADRLMEALACVEICPEGDFDGLRAAWLAHAAELSGCVCVFLDWDTPRRALVRLLRDVGVSVVALVVVDPDAAVELDPGPLADRPGCFGVLKAGMVAGGLAQFGERASTIASIAA